MRFASLCVILATALPSMTFGDDVPADQGTPAAGIPAPGTIEPAPPIPPVEAVPEDAYQAPAPLAVPHSHVIPPQPAPVTNYYSTSPNPNGDCGLHGTRYSLSSRAYPPAPADDGTTSYGPGVPYGVIVGPGLWGGGWMGAHTGAYATGIHDRYPYYSYRASWYTPGPRSTNITITW